MLETLRRCAAGRIVDDKTGHYSQDEPFQWVFHWSLALGLVDWAGWMGSTLWLNQTLTKSHLKNARMTIMKILLLSSAHNSLAQLAHVWLKASRYDVSVAAAGR